VGSGVVSIPSNTFSEQQHASFKLQNRLVETPGHHPKPKATPSKSFGNSPIYNNWQVQGGAWSRQKEKKFANHFKPDTLEQVGPGKYLFGEDQVKIFKKKSTHQFMSTTLRSTQEKNGFKANLFLLQKLKNEAMQLAENEVEIYQIEDQKITRDNFIANEHQNPGPGYYHTEKAAEKSAHQMSKQTRFPEQRCHSSCAPGEYSSTAFNTFYKTTQGQFLEGQKFKQQTNEVPGPGAYALNNQVPLNLQMRDQLRTNKLKWDSQMKKRTNEQLPKPVEVANIALLKIGPPGPRPLLEPRLRVSPERTGPHFRQDAAPVHVQLQKERLPLQN